MNYIISYMELASEQDSLGRLRWTAAYLYAVHYALLDTDFIEMMMAVDRELKHVDSG